MCQHARRRAPGPVQASGGGSDLARLDQAQQPFLSARAAGGAEGDEGRRRAAGGLHGERIFSPATGPIVAPTKA